jgi:hypothetical protein
MLQSVRKFLPGRRPHVTQLGNPDTIQEGVSKTLQGDYIRGHSLLMLRNLHLTALRAFEAATRTQRT